MKLPRFANSSKLMPLDSPLSKCLDEAGVTRPVVALKVVNAIREKLQGLILVQSLSSHQLKFDFLTKYQCQ